MCGRFTLRTEPAEFWPAEQLSIFTARYNIAPSQPVPAIRVFQGRQQAVDLHWGLVPYWADDPKIGYRMINARSETLSEKSAFRNAFRQRRCLVLADGYYEWKTDGKKKQPFYVHMKDHRPFAFAGLWESWRGSASVKLEQPLESCTIVTTVSNELTADVHERMPAILTSEDAQLWLDPEFQGVERLTEMLRPYESDEMRMYPVSTLVNKPANDSAECIARETIEQQQMLF